MKVKIKNYEKLNELVRANAQSNKVSVSDYLRFIGVDHAYFKKYCEGQNVSVRVFEKLHKEFGVQGEPIFGKHDKAILENTHIFNNLVQ